MTIEGLDGLAKMVSYPERSDEASGQVLSGELEARCSPHIQDEAFRGQQQVVVPLRVDHGLVDLEDRLVDPNGQRT